jgi:hypothetical protein
MSHKDFPHPSAEDHMQPIGPFSITNFAYNTVNWGNDILPGEVSLIGSCGMLVAQKLADTRISPKVPPP